MYNEEDSYQYENWINQFRSMHRLTDQLRFISSILNSLDENQQEMFHMQIVKFETLLQDPDFMRALNYRDALITQFPVEYYGEDRGQDDPYKFNNELENQINKIQAEIIGCLGLVIKQKNKADFVIGDEA